MMLLSINAWYLILALLVGAFVWKAYSKIVEVANHQQDINRK